MAFMARLGLHKDEAKPQARIIWWLWPGLVWFLVAWLGWLWLLGQAEHNTSPCYAPFRVRNRYDTRKMSTFCCRDKHISTWKDGKTVYLATYMLRQLPGFHTSQGNFPCANAQDPSQGWIGGKAVTTFPPSNASAPSPPPRIVARSARNFRILAVDRGFIGIERQIQSF
ncbi:hypothetical protein OE88DRAFT_1643238 [Heliocybe sulcata]|uniref:Uncharacterized protein n=1 Tax=Heliocybe sulcata TaxID=5364 RepID=A0A5C3NBW7_9AGAM|nr:hypothetical protein OE88DRAFT_1643238 [Heliocybe sulcata]